MELTNKNDKNSSKIDKQSESKYYSDSKNKFDFNKEEIENLNSNPIGKQNQFSLNSGQNQKSSDYQNKKSHKNLSLIIFYMILLILNTIFNYLIKPISTIFDIVYLTNIVGLSENGLKSSIGTIIIMIGWLILIILPLFHLFTTGIGIIGVHESFFGKLWAVMILLIEIILNIPLTFLYESNMYSIYLFEEKKYKQLLNPWLVFFPTEYTESKYEIVRNFIHPGFFFLFGIIKYQKIKTNTINRYLKIILVLQILLCISRFLGNLVITIKKIKDNVFSKDDKNVKQG